MSDSDDFYKYVYSHDDFNRFEEISAEECKEYLEVCDEKGSEITAGVRNDDDVYLVQPTDDKREGFKIYLHCRSKNCSCKDQFEHIYLKASLIIATRH